jgi:hypothetical protein
MTVTFSQIYPVLRMFSEEKTREFYLDFLGFTVDFEHRFDDNAPLFLQVRRDSLILRLTEHHGDACPGSAITVATDNLDELHKELIGKNYRYMRPGIEKTPWKTRDLTVMDPSGNRITFSEKATDK